MTSKSDWPPDALIRHVLGPSVDELRRNDPGVRAGTDPEAVHRFRVATRRLRSDLRTFRRFLATEPTGELRDELKWLGGAVGPVRDLDVLRSRFADVGVDLSGADRPGVAAVLDRVASERHEARALLLDALRTDRYDALVTGLVSFAAHPTTDPGVGKAGHRPVLDHAPKLVKHRWKQLASAVDAAGSAPTDEDLHRIRIAAKRCRYAAEAVAPVVGQRATRFAARVEGVQTVLGAVHDTVVAEAWLRDVAVELVDHRVAIGILIARERQDREVHRGEWPRAWHRASRPKARQWL